MRHGLSHELIEEMINVVGKKFVLGFDTVRNRVFTSRLHVPGLARPLLGLRARPNK